MEHHQWGQMLDLMMASAIEPSIVDCLEPGMDNHSVFLMGSLMAATTAILMVWLMGYQTMIHLMQFHGQMLDLPMA